jgi:hypothetical protein
MDYYMPVLGFREKRLLRFESHHCLLYCLPGGLLDTIYNGHPLDSASRDNIAKENLNIITGKATVLMAVKTPEAIT